MENHRTDSIPNDSYPVKSDRLLGAGKSPPDALVFADLNGEPRLPNAITKEWERTARAAGMSTAGVPA